MKVYTKDMLSRRVEQERPPQHDDFEKRISWKNFINNTTFHGIKYIFSGNLMLRRFIWLLVVSTAIVLFVAQVSDRTSVFFEHKSNVDVKVTYADKVDFPAVTICNQNSYRMSVTAKLNLYEFINSLYSTKDLKDFNISEYNVNDINATDFVVTTAHRKEDLIHRCTWHRTPCNISKDFKTTLTDLGVCYTFNYDNQPLSVVESGSKSALCLSLNVEQYEYMKGEEIDAGVKILLHDQGEVPQMKDQGFAVAPGTHTLVGVERVEVSSLPHPYGGCENDNPEPVSECQLRCKASALFQLCDCHDIFMKPVQNGSVSSKECSMEEKFTCAHRPNGLQQGSCNCAVPCKRVLYKPNLSYSQLSQFNIERFVIDDNATKVKLQHKFYTALETGQRVIREVAEKDERQIENLISAKNRFNLTLSTWFEMWRARKHVEEFITKSFHDDGLSISAFSQDKLDLLSLFNNWKTNIHSIYQLQQELSKLLALDRKNGSYSTEVDFLKHCAHKGNNSLLSDAVPLRSVTDALNNTTARYLNKPNDCAAAFLNLKEQLRNISSVESILHFKNLELICEAIINGTFIKNDSTVELNRYEKCFSSIKKAKGITDSFSKILRLINNILETKTLHVALGYVKDIIAYLTDVTILQNTFEGMDTKLGEACRWISGKSYQVKEEVNSAKRYLGQARNSLDAVSTVITTLNLKLLWYLYSDVDDIDILKRMVEVVDKYTEGNISKLTFAEDFRAVKFKNEIDYLSSLHMSIKEHISGLTFQIDIGSYALKRGYSILANSELPVINKYNVFELELFNLAATINDSTIQWLLLELSHHAIPTIARLTAKHVLNEYIEDLKKTVIEPMDDLLAAIEMIRENLENYEMSARMDSSFFMNNFIQVDIFYQELSYEEIEQNIAFEFLSLLSEIGGFLGLLLGASVLTVCELVDYITMATLGKFKRTKQFSFAPKFRPESSISRRHSDPTSRGLDK